MTVSSSLLRICSGTQTKSAPQHVWALIRAPAPAPPSTPQRGRERQKWTTEDRGQHPHHVESVLQGGDEREGVHGVPRHHTGRPQHWLCNTKAEPVESLPPSPGLAPLSPLCHHADAHVPKRDPPLITEPAAAKSHL